jgi:hypothetical protein
MAALSIIGFLVPLLFVAVIVLVIGAVVSGRSDPDTTGRRPYAIYLSVVVFVGLLSTVGAAFATLKTITDTLFVDKQDYVASGGRDVLLAVLILAAVGALTYYFGRKLLELRQLEPGSSSPAARVLLVFAYAVSFVSLFTVLITVIGAITAFVDVVDPSGGFGGGRDQGASTLLSSLATGAIAGWLYLFTWRTFDLGLHPATGVASTPPPPTP